MRRTTTVSTIAATALLFAAAYAGAQPPDKGGKREQKHGGGDGPGGGGRPVVMPRGPMGAPPAPMGGGGGGFDKQSMRRQERENRGPAQVEAFRRGGEVKSHISSGGGRPPEIGRIKNNEGPSFGGGGFAPQNGSFKRRDDAPGGFQPPAGFPGGPQQFGSRQPERSSRGGGDWQGQIRQRDDFKPQGGRKSAADFTSPRPSGNGSVKPRGQEAGGNPFGAAAPGMPGSVRERGSKAVVNPSGKPSFGVPDGLDTRGAKNNVIPKGPSGKSGFGGDAGLPPGLSKETVRGRGAQGNIVPGGKNGPPVGPGAGNAAVAGKSGFPGGVGTVVPKGGSQGVGGKLPPGVGGVPFGNAAVAGKSGFDGGVGSVVPKGVARGITGNLPPGLAGKAKLIPAAGAFPGLSGKAVALPAGIQSSAVQAFHNVKGSLHSDRPVFLPRLGAPEKAMAIGVNLGLGAGVAGFGVSRLLSEDDALTFYGGIGTPVVEPYSLTKQDIVALRGGYLPAAVPPPLPGFGYVHPPVVPAAVYAQPGFLPPPIVGAVEVAPTFSWEYWDGRSHYDHSYASNLFVSVGHTRHDGYDGAIVGGRYYAFGYGWMDGCINYGEGRVWVPGFWAPQPVTECRPVPVWMPPVYEDVWTGCCWETVQVGGGHFAPAPVDECHTVTRYVWVPGHYEYCYV